jgi:small-conductance mechanosensitive channel
LLLACNHNKNNFKLGRSYFMELLLEPIMSVWLLAQQKVILLTDHTHLHRLLYVGSIFAGAWLLAMGLHFFIRRYFDTEIKQHPHARKAYELFKPVLLPLIALVFLGTGQAVLSRQGDITPWFDISVNLTTAWVVLGHLFTTTVWLLVAADLLDILQPSTRFLDSVALPLGAGQVSLLDILQGAVTLSLLFWLAGLISQFLEYYLTKVIKLKAVASVLIMKIVRVGLITLAFLITLTILGIDLTALAVFGGALGVGLGFGLQKVVSNYISGIIILTDKSIKPGDVIEVGDSYGHIAYLGARYISVVTPDGREHLIPNEEFITTKVINWSYSNDLVSQRIPIGVSYNADIDRAIDICIECTRDIERVLKDPAPNCMVQGFGANSIDLLLIFWLKDPKNGILNVKSPILRNIWKRFKEEGIEIPFPQMDVHVKSLPSDAVAKPNKKTRKTS